MKEKNLDELNRIYSDADECDKEVFAEMRSNILLVAGEHYAKANSKIVKNIRTSSNASQSNEQKLRLTKNHMHRAHRIYTTEILSESPGTTIKPQRDTEMQDQKDAELNQSVWQDIKARHKIKEKKVPKWASTFTKIGELCVKVFWDPMAGRLLGYEPAVDEDGQPVYEHTEEMDQFGQPVMAQAEDKTKPIFSGDFVFEDVYGFNLLREKSMSSMDEMGRCWIVRKMVDTEVIKAQYRDNPDIVNKIHDSKDETYVVFDANKGGYNKVKGQVMVREYYWPVCPEYPEGYFVYATKDVILASGPLPFGIWPLIWQGFDESETTPRGRSILKVARPYQGEINRASSQIAVAQVSLGDDKVLYQSGTKLSPGALLPGVRGISYQGRPPDILPGRDGSQYLPYVQSQISELDMVLMLQEANETNENGQVDPYALLFRSFSKKKRFGPYCNKFKAFLVDLTETVLKLAKEYLPDDMLVPAIGRREWVNLAEFRKTTPLCYQIGIEPQDDTIETQFGKQLTFQHILQYVGKDLDQRTIGKLIKNSPWANSDDTFDDLTIDEDIAKNDMLALERGEPVEPTPYIDADFMIKKLTSRIKKPDFRVLAPEIQQAYNVLKTQYEQLFAEQQQAVIDAKNEYIPVDGALVTCDFYITDPNSPENQAKRAKIPQRALEWLLKQLEAQGMSLDKLENMNAQSLSEMAQMLMARQGNGVPQQLMAR